MGPLHGVPMILKDQFDIKGYDSTLGYVGRAFKPAQQDCVLVAMLRKNGCHHHHKVELTAKYHGTFKDV